MTTKYTRPFSQISRDDLPLVGGKGANLGILTAQGIPVPDGFCVTTTAFNLFLQPFLEHELYAKLKQVPADVEQVKVLGKQIRDYLQTLPLPEPVFAELKRRLAEYGLDQAYSVRSSATAEDLPEASFAGQQDTYLNVEGVAEIAEAVRNCFVSLYTDRAILYRVKNNFAHEEVKLSAVVQRMVLSEQSGILFTADPLTGHRYTVSIDASYGLGEALVGGLVTPDLYQVDVRDWQVTKTQVSEKKIAIYPLPGGGTEERELTGARVSSQVLSPAEIVELAKIGARIQDHYGVPQDIEWARVGSEFFILQARPITSLYPLGDIETPPESLRIFMSFGHQQMMTDVLTPFSLSLFRTLMPLEKNPETGESEVVLPVGGRMYADLSRALRHPLLRKVVFAVTSQFAELAPATLNKAMARPEFARGPKAAFGPRSLKVVGSLLFDVLRHLFVVDTREYIPNTNQKISAYLEEVTRCFEDARGDTEKVALVQRIFTTQDNLSAVLLARQWIPAFIAAELAKRLLIKLTPATVTDAELDAVTLALPGNVVTQMNLHVGDLADLAREEEVVRDYFARGELDPGEFEQVLSASGGRFARSWREFMELYGARGPSEIDISRPKWFESPRPLLQMIKGYLQKEPGIHRRQHETLAINREQAAASILKKSGDGLFAPLRGPLVRRFLTVIENLGGLREHHKYMIVRVLRVTKGQILEIAKKLSNRKLLEQPTDVWYLTLPELRAVTNEAKDCRAAIQERQAEYARWARLNPPLILTSHGEAPVVEYEVADLPEGALAGSAVSSGVYEGVARVIHDPQSEVLNKGEILVTSFTDPGWTPLFINAGALVLEIGGTMTHGSVVAREYGIPAVVGIRGATQAIPDRARVRVDGNRGVVEILD